MFQRTTSLIAAAAVALSLGGVAPAQAGDNDDLARLLFGAIATGLIAQAISEANDKDRQTVRREVTINRHVHRYPHGSKQPNPERTVTVTRPQVSSAVPASCRRTLNTQNGRRTFVGQPCLQQAGYSTARLPRACERKLEFDHRDVRAWNVGCLSDRGYRFR